MSSTSINLTHPRRHEYDARDGFLAIQQHLPDLHAVRSVPIRQCLVEFLCHTGEILRIRFNLTLECAVYGEFSALFVWMVLGGFESEEEKAAVGEGGGLPEAVMVRFMRGEGPYGVRGPLLSLE